jgi:hypothetical protein
LIPIHKENLLPLHCLAKPAIIIEHQFHTRTGIVAENSFAFCSEFGAELDRVAISLSERFLLAFDAI